MSWRTVIVTERCKLDYNMGYMVIRGEETKRIFIDEIAILIVENTAVSLTCCLLEALNENKVQVIFCDAKRSPMAELIPYYGSHDCSKKIKMQIDWKLDIQGIVWREIIADKIGKQCSFLKELHKERESQLLEKYLLEIDDYDETNREGHAAKVYFNALFGTGFNRNDDNVINSSLNYGYGIILSAFNREIVSSGYLTQIGIFHKNMFNYFNLSCDIMEPFRILIDRMVYSGSFAEFGTKEKALIVDILNNEVRINGTKQTILNAIKIYTKSVFDALNFEDISRIKTYEL